MCTESEVKQEYIFHFWDFYYISFSGEEEILLEKLV